MGLLDQESYKMFLPTSSTVYAEFYYLGCCVSNLPSRLATEPQQLEANVVYPHRPHLPSSSLPYLLGFNKYMENRTNTPTRMIHMQCKKHITWHQFLT